MGLYYDETVSTIDEYLKVHDNLNGLKYNYDDREKSYIVRNFKDRVNEPVYGNIWNGLAICIHSLYGNEIEIRDFEKEENGYSYTLHFTMYDVFGLDSDDIEKGERFFVIYLDMVLLEGLGHGIFYNIGTNIMVHINLLLHILNLTCLLERCINHEKKIIDYCNFERVYNCFSSILCVL